MSISFLPLKCFFRVDYSRFKAIQQNMSTNVSQNMPENSDNLRYLKSQNCDITQKVEAPIRFRNNMTGSRDNNYNFDIVKVFCDADVVDDTSGQYYDLQWQLPFSTEVDIVSGHTF